MIAAQAVAAPAAEEEAPALTTLDQLFSLTKDPTTDQGQLTIALLAGDIELAVDLAIKQNRLVSFIGSNFVYAFMIFN